MVNHTGSVSVLVLNELVLSRHPYTFVATATTSYTLKYDRSLLRPPQTSPIVASELSERPRLISVP